MGNASISYDCFRFLFVIFNQLVKGIFGLIAISLLLVHPCVLANEIYMAEMTGGQIVKLVDDVECEKNCTREMPITSFLAIAEKGYRFVEWKGRCADTLGPLCTVKGDSVSVPSATFTTSQISISTPTKALLLLHGIHNKPTVWNEFVSQFFNNQCPVVYGGIVLGEDSSNPNNHVLCYRIAFGYYDLLNHSDTGQNAPYIKENDNSIVQDNLTNEIMAAVLGILNRHPKLTLGLVGQHSAIAPALSFSASDVGRRANIVALLDLSPKQLLGTKTVLNQLPVSLAQAGEPATSNPQPRKISSTLAQTTNGWWLNK